MRGAVLLLLPLLLRLGLRGGLCLWWCWWRHGRGLVYRCGARGSQAGPGGLPRQPRDGGHLVARGRGCRLVPMITATDT